MGCLLGFWKPMWEHSLWGEIQEGSPQWQGIRAGWGGWIGGGDWETARRKRGQVEGASFYKRMINDNSTGNKTKHPSCCQSHEASTFRDAGTGSPIHLPWGVFWNWGGETGILGLVRRRGVNLSHLSSSMSPCWGSSGLM